MFTCRRWVFCFEKLSWEMSPVAFPTSVFDLVRYSKKMRCITAIIRAEAWSQIYPDFGTLLVFDVFPIVISTDSADHKSSGIFTLCRTLSISHPRIVDEVTAVWYFPQRFVIPSHEYGPEAIYDLFARDPINTYIGFRTHL